MASLSARLLLAVSLLLLVFFGSTIAMLDAAFREAGAQAQRHIIDGHLMSLLAAAEPEGNGELDLPADLPEPRFGNPESGLYGELRDARGEIVWRSRSAEGIRLPFSRPAEQGRNHYASLQLDDGTELATSSLAVDWELPDGSFARYTFSVAESMDEYHAQSAAFRRRMFGWFGAAAVVMLLAIALAMRGLLRPLRQIEREIGEIEEGQRQALSGNFPSELSGVAGNMNILIGSERARAERYRNTLDNLAHSLKTPLAAARSVIAESPDSALGRKVAVEIERMNDIVRYQLRKPAATVSERLGLNSVAVEKELSRLVEGLAKVYKEKSPEIIVEVAPGAAFRGDRGDFLEVAGNLLDNACKWCRRQVRLSLRPAPGEFLSLTVADDGPGIPEEVSDLLLERGARLDETEPGHGIGLAVVREIAASYGGEVRIGRSATGGAEVTVTLKAG